MNRYLKSFSFVFVLYTALFASYIYTPSPTRHNTQAKKSIQDLHFTIIQEQKKSVVVPKKVLKKKKPTVPKKSKTKKNPKKKLVKKRIIKKTVAPKTLHKPINQKVEAPIKTKNIPHIDKQIPQKQIKKNNVTKQTKVIDDNKNKVKKLLQQKYFTQIKQLINQNKLYPKIAIKRGIEGVVKISFTISKHGELLSVHIIEGKKVFQKSIKQAVKKSFPNIPPPGIFDKNVQLSLTIAYKLY